jgi:uncharacterized protein YgiM (DUF1202 family)
MARKKKQGSNVIGWVILGAMAFGIYQFGIVGSMDRPASAAARPVGNTAPASPKPASAPLDAPRYVDVAVLNVRHTPGTSGPLVTTLPRGAQLKVLGRQDGWLLVDLSPTLEGWVAEHLTTTEAPAPSYRPPAPVKASR